MINIKAKKKRECVYKKVLTTDAVKKIFWRAKNSLKEGVSERERQWLGLTMRWN